MTTPEDLKLDMKRCSDEHFNVYQTWSVMIGKNAAAFLIGLPLTTCMWTLGCPLWLAAFTTLVQCFQVGLIYWCRYQRKRFCGLWLHYRNTYAQMLDQIS